ncbi:MAG: regulatory protein RecX [Armatimonadota bacterium]
MTAPERSVVTAIEPQVKRPDRVSIFVDGEFVLGVHVEVAAAVGLRVGQTVDVQQLQALALAEEKRRARDSALKLLGYRARSRTELRQRLQRQGYEPELVEETLELLARSGYIDDAEFSRAWVRARTGPRRPLGARRIAAELRQKGVEQDLIREALEPLDSETELELALAVGRRKVEQMHGEDPRVVRRKVGAALMRRGFGWEVCARVLDILLAAE